MEFPRCPEGPHATCEGGSCVPGEISEGPINRTDGGSPGGFGTSRDYAEREVARAVWLTNNGNSKPPLLRSIHRCIYEPKAGGGADRSNNNSVKYSVEYRSELASNECMADNSWEWLVVDGGPRLKRKSSQVWACPHCRMQDKLIGFRSRNLMWQHIEEQHHGSR